MEDNKCTLFSILVLFCSSLICISNFPITAADESKATYIIHVKQPAVGTFSENKDLDSYYQSFLPSNVSSIDGQQRIVYSYRNVVTGFAAKLTAKEAEEIQNKEGVLSAQPEKKLPLHTTHTPKFLGLHENVGVWTDSNFGKGVIIGVLDTGITPSHPSFSDYGVPPPPAKWKGKCDFNVTACNNKLIGARNFIDSSPPSDDAGHGTHTSSTAGGNFVRGASALGNANGTAVGMAPKSHIAMYKVCTEEGCPDSAMLAALDAAVEDGVDILSISIGGGPTSFSSDTIAIGTFGAVKKGIFVSCSAGNEGPFNSTLSNEAPWILTVGASTIDRKIVSTAQLGNGQEYDGESLFQPRDFPSTQLPLVFPGTNGNASIAQCLPGSLRNANVKGKVVVCLMGSGRILKGKEVKDTGGAAMILINEEILGDTTLVDAHVLPATHVNSIAGQAILSYISSTPRPTAAIKFKGTMIGDKTAPVVSFFSSRGPSIASPGILKPDIIGPGVSILAAWPFPLNNNTDIFPTFNVVSGTSMSCPHLSGIAALIKSSHPDWSPAAIKSAIMTTAYTLNLENKPIYDQTLTPANLFTTGSGHVNPSKANDPGLIYDIKPDDYIPYLCGLGYNDTEVQLIVQEPVKCSQVGTITEGELNYPSFTVKLVTSNTKVRYSRTVTNVGPSKAYFKSEIIAPEGVDIGVYPGDLEFNETGQSLSYRVDFSRSVGYNMTKAFSEGALIWVSEKHTVRSPIVVLFK